MSKKQTTSLKNMVDRERHRVAATVTQEGQWPQSEPNQGLARMFVIMLIVHVVIIGGIIVYDFIGDGSDVKQVTAAPKTTPVKQTTTATQADSHLPTVDNATAAVKPVSETPVPAPVPTAAAPKSPDSLLPAAANVIPSGSETPASTADAVNSAAKVESIAPQAPVPMSVTASEPEAPKSNVSIVSLPPAPKAESKPVVEEPATKAKPAPKDEAPRAVSLGNTEPKHVPTPSDARKSIEREKHSSPPPTVKKKVDDTPPAPVAKKKTEEAQSAPKKKVAEAPASAPKGSTRHTVSKKDTLWSISRRYKTTPDAIIKANNIKNPDLLTDGKVLIIPGK